MAIRFTIWLSLACVLTFGRVASAAVGYGGGVVVPGAVTAQGIAQAGGALNQVIPSYVVPLNLNTLETNDYFTGGFTPTNDNGHFVWNQTIGALTNLNKQTYLFYDNVNAAWAIGPSINTSLNVDFIDNNSPSYITNVAWAQVNGTVVGVGSLGTNSVSTVGYLTNYTVPQGQVVVCPYTDQLTGITNNPQIFGPWMGSNYVQQAINACAKYTNLMTAVGGGKVWVVGINYCPAPLTFSNAFNNANLVNGPSYPNYDNVVSFSLEAPSFTSGGLVCLTNPCIRVVSGTMPDIYFEAKNLIISSLQNQTTNLLEIKNAERCDVTRCWFGWWNALTNHQNIGNLAGMSVPTTGTGIGAHDLTLLVAGAGVDFYNFNDNSLLGIQGVFFNPDHGHMERNLFSICGGSSDWKTNSIYSSGACIVIGVNANADRVFSHNYFYGGGNDYCTSQTAGTDISYGDRFESGGGNIIRVNGGYVTQIMPLEGQLTSMPVSNIGTVTNTLCFSSPDNPAGFHLGATTNPIVLYVDNTGVQSTVPYLGTGSGLTNLFGLLYTNSGAGYLTTGGFKTASVSGEVYVTVCVTNNQIVWLTNQTTHDVRIMGNTTGTWTNFDNASLPVNSGDSVAVTNVSGGNALLVTSRFYSLH